ncbi:hypothetical protein [Promicromonospora soli]
MPNSLQRRAVQIRRRYTGEKDAAARAGAGRDGSHGLDVCSPAQAELRALFALGFLNDTDAGRHLGWSISVLSAYSLVVSPRYDSLVLIADAPINVAERLMPDGQVDGGLPGLRLERAVIDRRSDDELYISHVLHHLPTGGRIVVTDHPEGKVTGELESFSSTKSMPATDVPLQPREAAQLRDASRMSADARTLLSAIVSRISTRDPDRNWALGHWFYDPLSRQRRPYIRKSRALRGTGDQWELRWSNYPYPSDLVATLTDRTIGVVGATATSNGEESVVRLGTASLRLLWELS